MLFFLFGLHLFKFFIPDLCADHNWMNFNQCGYLLNAKSLVHFMGISHIF